MQQTEPADRAWVVDAARALAGIISGIRRVDHPAIAEAVTELLRAATAYVRATTEEPADNKALRAAVERLSRLP